MVGNRTGMEVAQLLLMVRAQDIESRSDAQLLQQFLSGRDEEAFATLVQRHAPMVLGVCRRLLKDSADADDAFQATFMVLVRRAASLSRPDQLAGWLNRTAFITARKIRNNRYRRQARQVPLGEPGIEDPVADIVWRELTPIFDEELDRLPDRLRLPIVHCFLEGRSKRAAAAILGWPEGTISSRLQRARELLRSRLTKRGIALSASAFNLALCHATASARVPATLISTTIQTASQIAAGTLLSCPVAILTEGVLHSMFVAKIKLIAVMVLSVGILGAGTGWIFQSTGSGTVASAEDGPAKGTEKKIPPKPQPKEKTNQPDPNEDPQLAALREKNLAQILAEKQARDRAAVLQARREDERLKVEEALRNANELAAEARAQRDRATAEREQALHASSVREAALQMQLEAEKKKFELLITVASKLAPNIDWPNVLKEVAAAQEFPAVPHPSEKAKPANAPPQGANPFLAPAQADAIRADSNLQLAIRQVEQAKVSVLQAKAAEQEASARLTAAQELVQKLQAEAAHAPKKETPKPMVGQPQIKRSPADPNNPEPEVLNARATLRLREADLKIAGAKLKLNAAQMANVKQLARNNAVGQLEVVKAECDLEIATAEFEKAQILVEAAAAELKQTGK